MAIPIPCLESPFILGHCIVSSIENTMITCCDLSDLLSEVARGVQAAERSLAELKEFAAQLKALPNIQRHIGLAEAVNRAIATPAFRTRVSVEQSLLDGHGLDASAESIEVSTV